MPTYEYSCPKCGTFDFVQKITEDALKICPTCSSPVKRLVSAAAFHLKGSGWYKTDYGSSGSAGTAPSSTTSSSSSTSSSSDSSSSAGTSGGGEKKSSD